MNVRRANPVEAAVGLAAALIGLLGLVQGGPASPVLAALWPGWGAYAYYVGLLLGGCFLIAGMLITTKRPSKASINLWEAGLLAIAFTWGAYGLALAVFLPATALTSSLVLLTISVGTFVRWLQVRKIR